MTEKTPLYDLHVEAGARMGGFAGFEMPLFYKQGTIKEHEWVRSHAGMFDVSHMGQVIIQGSSAAEFLEKITPSGFQDKPIGRAQYTVLTNEEGGIIDDLIITRVEDNKFFVVLNAGCKGKDLEWIKSHLPAGVRMKHWDEHCLIAVQGGWAERIIHETLEIEAHDLNYMEMMEAEGPLSEPIYVSRLGYTGEDGFEISVPNAVARETWEYLSNHPEIKQAGLAARDSLRLEMGYPLYGHDIDDTTSPIEASLRWVVSKNTQGYFGYDRIQKEIADGVSRKRVGVKITENGIAREGAEIFDENGNKVGALTSGGFSPTLKHGIGQGYVTSDASKKGTKVFVEVRGKKLAAEIAPLSFLEPKTKSINKAA